MTERFDIVAIRRDYSMPTIVGATLKLQRAGNEWKACCPFHDDRSPSFTIYDGGARAKCFGCGWSGDVLDFVQRAHAVSLPEAARLLGAGELPMIQTAEPSAPYSKENRRDEAISIWRSAVAAPRTRAETYLRERAISMDIPASLRFTQLPYGKSGPSHPVMIGLVASVDNCALGIHRTYLNPTGTGKASVPKPKLSLGAIRGGAVRLGPAASTLAVTEGIEDALSLQQELGLSAWAGVGTSGLVAMRLPMIVREVVIGADADDAGESAATEAAERFSREGRSVRIIRPAAPHKDFNAELMAGGAA